jgi:protein FRA10AC1
MSLYPPKPSSSTSVTTEFDILKASHKFLREEDQDTADAQTGSWNDQLAQKYYDSLFREFAVCDLKHYKSGNVRAILRSRHFITKPRN